MPQWSSRLVIMGAALMAAHCTTSFEVGSEEWTQAKRVQVNVLRPAAYPLEGIQRLAFDAPGSLEAADIASGMAQDLQSTERFDMSSNQAQARITVAYLGNSIQDDITSDTAMQDGNVTTTYVRTVTVLIKVGTQVTDANQTSLASFETTIKTDEEQGKVAIMGEAVRDKAYQRSLFSPPATTDLLRAAKRRAARTLAQQLVPYYENKTVLLYTIDLPNARAAAQKAQESRWSEARSLAAQDSKEVPAEDKSLDAKAHYNLGMTLLFDGDAAGAVAHLTQAQNLHPNGVFKEALKDAQGHQKALAQVANLGYTPHLLQSL